MNTPVSRFLLLKKHKKKANITATAIDTMAIVSFHIYGTPSEWSISIIKPMPVRLNMDKIVTKAVIALGKHCTSCDHKIPIASDMMTLNLIESYTSRKSHF